MISSTLAAESRAKPGKSELALWQSQYAGCCVQLAQWDVLTEYGKQTDNNSLLAESMAKLQDWRGLKEDILPTAMVSALPLNPKPYGERRQPVQVCRSTGCRVTQPQILNHTPSLSTLSITTLNPNS